MPQEISQWYYVDQQQKPQGPFTGERIKQYFQAGIINKNTNLWHDKLTEWLPLHQFYNTLKIQQADQNTSSQLSAPQNVFQPIDSDNNNRSPYAASSASINLQPQNIPILGYEVVYAGFWKRVAAYLLDFILMSIVTLIVQMLVIMPIVLSANHSASPPSSMRVVLLLIMPLSYLVVPLAIHSIYYGFMHTSKFQATIGKMAVGIKVARSDGSRISRGLGIARYFADLLNFFLFLLSYIVVAFTDRKQGLHDLICNTVVVDKWAFTEHPEHQNREIGTAAFLILAIFGILMLTYFVVIFSPRF